MRETSPYSKSILKSSSIALRHVGDVNSMIETLNSNFSEAAGFKRVGAHCLILPPGARTSFPHAESLEEEFAFVVKGHPHVWINGYVYELKPNHAVGFPAGTGDAHCFINNTESDVELLVFGERTKKENRCAFPFHPDYEIQCGIPWPEAPKHLLGPHVGRPGAVKPNEIGKVWPSNIVDCNQFNATAGWHYAGDSETFGECTRLTDLIGLKRLGINFEHLQPGKRSAFPHAHKKEEEFAFILSGEATIWMNGFPHLAPAGTAACFVPNTNVAHGIINDSDQLITFIVVGEAEEDGFEDRIYYPKHEFRNVQCQFKKEFWEDRPLDVLMGPHDGRPRRGLGEHLSLKHVSPQDLRTVLEIFQKSPTYFRNCDGCEPTMKSVEIAMSDGPAKRTPTYRKEFLFLVLNDVPIGVVDLHVDHPVERSAYIGLLLLTEEKFSRGLGRTFYRLIEHYVKVIYAVRKIHLGVADENDVSAFWRKMGFLPNGKTYEWKGENKTTHVVEFEKEI